MPAVHNDMRCTPRWRMSKRTQLTSFELQQRLCGCQKTTSNLPYNKLLEQEMSSQHSFFAVIGSLRPAKPCQTCLGKRKTVVRKRKLWRRIKKRVSLWRWSQQETVQDHRSQVDQEGRSDSNKWTQGPLYQTLHLMLLDARMNISTTSTLQTQSAQSSLGLIFLWMIVLGVRQTPPLPGGLP